MTAVKWTSLTLSLALSLSVGAVEMLEAKHRILFADPIEGGKRWVYEMEITNSGDSPIDQIELVRAAPEALPPLVSHDISIGTLEGGSQLVVHWLLETQDLSAPQREQASQSLFFRGTGVNHLGNPIVVEMMSQPDFDWFENHISQEVSP